MTILTGASDSDLKNTLNVTTSTSNNHYSDDNDEPETATTTGHHMIKNIAMKEELSRNPEKITVIELEKISFSENKRSVDSMDTALVNTNETGELNMPKKKKPKKSNKQQNCEVVATPASNININNMIKQINSQGGVNEVDMSAANKESMDGKTENATDFDLNVPKQTSLLTLDAGLNNNNNNNGKSKIKPGVIKVKNVIGKSSECGVAPVSLDASGKSGLDTIGIKFEYFYQGRIHSKLPTYSRILKMF